MMKKLFFLLKFSQTDIFDHFIENRI